MKLYSVIFKNNGKNYYFNGEDDYNIKDYVIVETEKGLQYGEITEIVKEELANKDEEYKNIIRKATPADTDTYYELLKENEEALQKCRELVKELDLNMSVINASFTFDKSQLLFNFTSDERVDFRELARKLAYIYHTRIELRQIGARDKAKIVGGVGVCGQKLCCQRFLNRIDAISMNMAKDQNLALNPSKINGVCGRLLCCLQYENDAYVACLPGMPSVGDVYNTKSGEGKVISIDILNRKFKVLVGSNKEEIELPLEDNHDKK